MGKICAIIPDDLEAQLRRYISETWPEHTFGKLRHVVKDAIERYLDQEVT